MVATGAHYDVTLLAVGVARAIASATSANGAL
jgi:hypothetical protein